MNSTLSGWRLLSRRDCSLCETMLHELHDWLGAAAQAIEVQDIDGDAELERRYGQRLPVLLIDDELVCAYRLDRARLTLYLDT